MMCADPKATIVTEDGKFIVQAKELQLVADVFNPSVIVSRIKGSRCRRGYESGSGMEDSLK